jgi:hypothetical protein
VADVTTINVCYRKLRKGSSIRATDYE